MNLINKMAQIYVVKNVQMGLNLIPAQLFRLLRRNFGMTKKKEFSLYKAALRRKKIAEAKKIKADRYVDEMNKRANEQSTTPRVL